jgi:uncharacterized membrane protein YeaQ/YmgE (transglycosylase-associated protein family)
MVYGPPCGHLIESDLNLLTILIGIVGAILGTLVASSWRWPSPPA